jgi:type II secretion system protein H
MMKRAFGFTTTELMTALCIIGILAALAVPNILGQMPRYRLSGAARQIMSDLMWSRMQAVSQKNEFMVFLSNDHEYTILDDDDNDGTVDDGEWTKTRDLQVQYRDVTLSLTADPVFFPRGSASPATFTVANEMGSKDVKIHITGRVKIQSNY